MLGREEEGRGGEGGEYVREKDGRGGRGREKGVRKGKGGEEEKEGRVGARFTRRRHAGVDTIN